MGKVRVIVFSDLWSIDTSWFHLIPFTGTATHTMKTLMVYYRSALIKSYSWCTSINQLTIFLWGATSLNLAHRTQGVITIPVQHWQLSVLEVSNCSQQADSKVQCRLTLPCPRSFYMQAWSITWTNTLLTKMKQVCGSWTAPCDEWHMCVTS